MPAKRAPGHTVSPADARPDELAEWCREEFPDLDIDPVRTWAAFYEIVDGNGLEYRNFVATCKNWIRRDIAANKFTMVCVARPKSKKELLFERAKEAGFRSPNKGEMVDDYERAIESSGKRDVQQVVQLVRGFGL